MEGVCDVILAPLKLRERDLDIALVDLTDCLGLESRMVIPGRHYPLALDRGLMILRIRGESADSHRWRSGLKPFRIGMLASVIRMRATSIRASTGLIGSAGAPVACRLGCKAPSETLENQGSRNLSRPATFSGWGQVPRHSARGHRRNGSGWRSSRAGPRQGVDPPSRSG